MANARYVSKMEVHLQGAGGVLAYRGNVMNVTVDHASNDQPVRTFGGNNGAGGLSGFTDGSLETRITFEEAIPLAGETVPLLDVMLAHKDVTLYGTVGGERRKYEGRIMKKAEKYGLDKPASADCEIMAGAPEIVRT